MAIGDQPTTFFDLARSLVYRVEAVKLHIPADQARQYLNTALHDIHIGFGEHFPWATRRGVLVTQAPYSTGTLSVNQGDTALTGVGTAWSTLNAFGIANVRAGGKMTVASGNEVYEIASVASDTAAVLVSDYVPSNASGAAYSYFEDEYALASDFLRPINQRQFSSASLSVELIDREDFEIWFPQNSGTGTPRIAAVIDLSFSGTATPRRRLRLAPAPSAALMIPYNYVTSNLAVTSAGAEAANMSASTDEPNIPLRYRHIIVLGALYQWYRDQGQDERAQLARVEYVDLLRRMVRDVEIGTGRPRETGPRIDDILTPTTILRQPGVQ